MTIGYYGLSILFDSPRLAHASTRVDPSAITAVVPVKDDELGLARTLRSLRHLHPSPRRVVVVDDGSSRPVLVAGKYAAEGGRPWLIVHRHHRNRGAAAARNTGLIGVSGWVYFTDCGCTHPTDLLDMLAAARNQAEPDVVAVAGPVHGWGNGRVARYMSEQKNLHPPSIGGAAQAIITANALVEARAACVIGGFDESFPSAGGEDLDFGLRLARIGRIAWSPAAAVAHEFAEDMQDFDRRCLRYGQGMRILAQKWRVPLDPYGFSAASPDLQDLADRQTEMMLRGYRGALHRRLGV